MSLDFTLCEGRRRGGNRGGNGKRVGITSEMIAFYVTGG